ncbi:MAG: hypothetical protein ACFFCW_01955 [Candidatus Hodarchaeota archaeon]
MDINKNQFISEDELKRRGEEWWPRFEVGEEVTINGYQFKIDSIEINNNRMILKPSRIADLLAQKIQEMQELEKSLKPMRNTSYKEALERYLEGKPHKIK